MPNWSDDEGRCHFDVDGEPCYLSAKGCPMHAAPARKKRERLYTRVEVEALLAAQREACARFIETSNEAADDLTRDDLEPVELVRATPLVEGEP